MDLTETQRGWALGPAVSMVDELRAKLRLAEAEVTKALRDAARAEIERDEARAEAKALKATLEAKFSWAK